jgi:hypothetical protein
MSVLHSANVIFVHIMKFGLLWIEGKFPVSSENELISVKFLYDSCEIPAFQRRPLFVIFPE